MGASSCWSASQHQAPIAAWLRRRDAALRHASRVGIQQDCASLVSVPGSVHCSHHLHGRLAVSAAGAVLTLCAWSLPAPLLWWYCHASMLTRNLPARGRVEFGSIMLWYYLADRTKTFPRGVKVRSPSHWCPAFQAARLSSCSWHGRASKLPCLDKDADHPPASRSCAPVCASLQPAFPLVVRASTRPPVLSPAHSGHQLGAWPRAERAPRARRSTAATCWRSSLRR